MAYNWLQDGTPSPRQPDQPYRKQIPARLQADLLELLIVVAGGIGIVVVMWLVDH